MCPSGKNRKKEEKKKKTRGSWPLLERKKSFLEFELSLFDH